MWSWGAHHQNWPTGACLAIWVLVTASLASSQINVLTYQYDNTRAGSNLHEKILTPRNVISTQFGKLFQHVVDGSVYAQPLYLSNVKIEGKGNHNVVYVATEQWPPSRRYF
jgi:hypothetical protein